jgi:hypothetical protein
MTGPKQHRPRWKKDSKRIARLLLNPCRGSFLEHLRDIRFLGALVILLALSTWISHVWILDHANLAGIDVFASVKRPRPARNSVVIKLTEADYNRIFGQCVNPYGLKKIIDAIVPYGPSVLALDIATPAESFRGLEIPESGTKLVWARVAVHRQPHEGQTVSSGYQWTAGEVLGHRLKDPAYTGVALFPQDSDWIVRTFQRWFRLGNGTLPSMHWEILRASCDSGSQEACRIVQNAPALDSRQHSLTNHYEFPPTALNDVLSPVENKALRNVEALQSDNVLRGKIVIVGAAFADDHPTPFGIQQGVDLIASAVETELDRTSEPFIIRGWSQLSVKLLLALILAALHHYLRPFYALSGTLLVVCGVISLSFVAYYYEALRLDFLPFVIGIWIEQLYQGAEHAQRSSPIKSH